MGYVRYTPEQYIARPEILLGSIFGVLLKIWHLADFTWWLGKPYHNDIHSQNGDFFLTQE